MQVSIEQFFELKAAAFSKGRMVDLAAMFVTPTTLHFGTKLIELPTAQDVAQVMTVYRQNLLIEGYSKTEASILHIEEQPDGGKQVFARWRNINGQGMQLDQQDSVYFCVPDAESQSWKITRFEYLEDPPPRFSQELPLK
ncbi:MAG: hypothetical protein AAF340_00970 [Pseudomonadota bacterium]